MPSEHPKMPGETHKSLLGHGSSKGLGLQAGEVAWYPNKKDLDQRGPRYAKRAGVVILMLGIIASITGFMLQT